MHYFFILTILAVGLSGIVAQVLLMRELLVSFYGNELTLGIILANWVILEALGVFISGKLVDRIKERIKLFIILEIIFSLLLPISIYLSRTFKAILGIPFAEAIGLNIIFFVSFIIVLPLSFCHGALFSAGCKIYSLFTEEDTHSIGRVYSWETLGTILGGIILTYLFIPYLHSFQIIFIISIANLIIALFFIRKVTHKKSKYVILVIIISALYLFLSISPTYFHRLSVNRQWHKIAVLDYENSLYGNIVTAKKEAQYTFFYNGTPIITTPYPDIMFVEEFGNLPLLFHHSPKDILVISGGAGGLINEILKHPIEKLDYAELDPLIIKMLKKYPSKLTDKELGDKRVVIINLDGRFFLRTTNRSYDVVLIGLSRPSDLSTNRLFTEESFFLAKSRLKAGGILALCLPGSLTYLSEELRDLNACILSSIKNAFGYVRLIPGDYNMLLASDTDEVLSVGADLINRRISELGIKTNILIPSYLDYRLDRRWLDWFKDSSIGATKNVNRDFAPFAVFKMLTLWNKQFSLKTAEVLSALENLNLKIIFLLIFIITLILFYLFRLKPGLAKLNIAYSIFTTGFFGMLVNLILIFTFQVFYGYLYHRMGLLISIFMSGIAIGSIYMTKRLEKIRNDLETFIRIEMAILIFSYLLALIITKLSGYLYFSLNFMLLFFISGLLIGLEFPLASKIYLSQRKEIGETAGLLYFADLIGGWLAGILGGIIFLPILGLFNTCMVIVIFKLSSLILLRKQGHPSI